MSGQDSTSISTPSARPRRASFSPAQQLSGLFSRSNPTVAATSAYPGPMANAAANAQTRRRMSISTLGLSGTSPTQTSPFGSAASRRESISSAGTGSAGLDESVIEEGDGPVTAPASPLARRMSIGARVLRDVRTGAASGNALAINGRAPIASSCPTAMTSSTSPRTRAFASSTPSDESAPLTCRRTSNVFPLRSAGEGFNWSDSLRSRAERASSLSANAPSPISPVAATAGQAGQQRAQTVANMPPPVQEMPKPRAPDDFQERILKGDFYMD